MKTSEEIYPESRRKEVYKQYSPELDKCIDALRAAEKENEEPKAVEKYGFLEMRKWFFNPNHGHYALILDELFNSVGFKYGKNFHSSPTGIDPDAPWLPAETFKVERLLIGEAHRKGWKAPVVEYNLNGELWILTKGGDTIFNGRTGKWNLKKQLI